MQQTPTRHEVWKMFDQISPTYDHLNHILSFGLDIYWRRKVAYLLPKKRPIDLLDLATGTADQLRTILDYAPQVHSAVGIDLAEKMLEIGRKKIAKRRFSAQVDLVRASADEIPYPAGSFDCATISFGIRNVPDVNLALKEMHRVLRKEGRALILEFSLPSNAALKNLHLFYLRHILPRVGGWISRNKSAYTYLNATIETFPSGEAFCQLMRNQGFINVQAHSLTGGIATIYSGEKDDKL